MSCVTAQAGPHFPFVNLRLIGDTRSQLCHDWRLSVSNSRESTLTPMRRLSELKVLIIHFLHFFQPERLRTPHVRQETHITTRIGR